MTGQTEGVTSELLPRTPARPALTSAYRRLLLATTVSGLGDGARMFAFLWFAARWTDDPRTVVLVLLAEQAPWLLVALPAGSLADRRDRRLIMCLSNAAAAVLLGGFAIALAEHITSIVLLASLGFLLSTARVMDYASANALLPDLVDKGQLFRANARLAAGQTVTMSLTGPLLGGLLCAAATALPFAFDSASFAVALVLLVRLPRDTRGGATARSSGWQANMLAGVRHMLRNPTLRLLGLLLGLVNLIVGAWLAVALLFASQILHLDAAGCGRLACASGVGGIVGAALAPRLASRLRLRGTMSLLLLVTSAALAVGGTTSTTAVSAVTLVIFTGSTMALRVVALSYQQSVVPAELLGRTQAALNLIAMTALPVGTLAGGLLAHRFGLRAPILSGALLALGGLGAVLLASHRPSLRSRSTATQAAMSPHQPLGPSAEDVLRNRAFQFAWLTGANPAAAAACLAAVVAVFALVVSSRPTEALPLQATIVATTPAQRPTRPVPLTAATSSTVPSPSGLTTPASSPATPQAAGHPPASLPTGDGSGRPSSSPTRSTLGPNPSPTPGPTATPTSSPTATPTATPSPTATTSPEPTAPVASLTAPAPEDSTPTSTQRSP